MRQLIDPNSREVMLLMKETGLAATSIEQGLTALRKAHFGQKWLYYQAFFLLTIGIERILKLIIIVHNVIEKDSFPLNNELRKYNHNLKYLHEKVLDELTPGFNFMKGDNLYQPIIDFLSKFALSSRYYNLDTLSGKSRNSDPLHEWHEIQKKIKSRYCRTKLSKGDNQLIEIYEQTAIFRYTDESDNPINNPKDYLVEGKYIDKVQGYSVLFVYKIINNLIKTLIDLPGNQQMLPYFQEFFPLFQSEYMTDIRIRQKKNWNYITK